MSEFPRKAWRFIEHPLTLTGAALVLALIGTKGAFLAAWVLFSIALFRTRFFEAYPPRSALVGNAAGSALLAVGLVFIYWHQYDPARFVAVSSSLAVTRLPLFPAWRWLFVGVLLGFGAFTVLLMQQRRLYTSQVKTVTDLQEQLQLTEIERVALEKTRDSNIKVHAELQKHLAKERESTANHYGRAESYRSERESHDWLYRVAESDRQSLDRLVFVVSCEAVNFNMEPHNAPFIEFWITVYNGSVYPVTILEPVKSGQIAYRESNYPLSGDLRIRDNGVIELPHGDKGIFKLRQVLVPHECELIRGFITAYPNQPYYTKAILEDVNVQAEANFQNGSRGSFRLKLPPTADMPLC